MTPDEIRRRLREIRLVARDDEAAHTLEDNLHRDVLEAIGFERCEKPVLCALLALRSARIKFERWSA